MWSVWAYDVECLGIRCDSVWHDVECLGIRCGVILEYDVVCFGIRCGVFGHTMWSVWACHVDCFGIRS